MTIHRWSIVLILCSASACAWAQRQLERINPPGAGPAAKSVVVYKSRGESGEVSYSGVPSAGATSLEVVIAPTIRRATVTPASQRGEVSPKTPPEIAIVSPADGAYLRTNNGDVTVSVNIDPKVLGDNRLIATIDGVPRKLDAQSFELTDLSRGEHELRLTLVSPDGEQLAPERVSTFRVARVSRTTPRRQVAAPQAPRPTVPTGPAYPSRPTPRPSPAGAARSP